MLKDWSISRMGWVLLSAMSPSGPSEKKGAEMHIQSAPPAPSLLQPLLYTSWWFLFSLPAFSFSFFPPLSQYSTGSPPRPARLPHAVCPTWKLSHFLLFLCKISSAPLLISSLQGSCRAEGSSRADAAAEPGCSLLNRYRFLLICGSTVEKRRHP